MNKHLGKDTPIVTIGDVEEWQTERAKKVHQREAIDALDHGEEVNGVAAFVGLEVADHVPLKLSGALADFDFGFLDAVLAEEGEAEIGGGADGGRGLVFADGLEGDGAGIAVGAGAGGGDAAGDVA